MRLLLTTLSLVLSFLSVTAGAAGLRDFEGGGLNVSLNTGGYRFVQDSKESFPASVVLQNRSRTPIPFTFNDAGPRWTFRIIGAEDTVLWTSNSDVATPQIVVGDELGAGERWKSTIRIPLVIDDVPLAPGVYTLQSFLNADKAITATSVFEVVAPPLGTTGIKGAVNRWNTSVGDGSWPQIGVSYGTPIAGARVTVTEILPAVGQIRVANDGRVRAPFFWSGTTDALGKFQVSTPPGSYRVAVWDKVETVQVGVSPGIEVTQTLTGAPLGTQAISVQQGSFSNVYFLIPSPVPPTITQGIKGKVSRAILTNEDVELTPTLEFKTVWSLRFGVSIQQIETPENTVPFTWTGTTDFFGNFQVATPPGKFRVTAGEAIIYITAGIAAPTASTTVTVAPDTVATANLVLSPGCVVTTGEVSTGQ